MKSKTDPIIDNVVNKFSQRSAVGISKYNTTLYDNNVDDFLIHAQEEAMDLVAYLEKLIINRDEEKRKANS